MCVCIHAYTHVLYKLTYNIHFHFHFSMFSNNMQHLKTLTISGIQNELWPDLFNKLYELKILEIVDSYYITYIGC